MTVRVGVIGTGFARRVQLPGLRLVPEVRVTAVASGRRENAEATAREHAIPHVFTDGAELARSGEVDLVLVSSTPDTHARYAIAALEAGKHVLCEKPTALNAAEAKQMLDCARGHPRQIAWIDHELRHEPNRRKVRELIGGGAGGAVATMLLTTVAHHGPGHFAQVTGSEGTFVLTGESQLEMVKPDGPLEDVSAPDDLWEKLTPNTMWARAFVRLDRDLVRVLAGATPTVPPATFEDGWRIQRVMDAVRAGGTTPLD